MSSVAVWSLANHDGKQQSDGNAKDADEMTFFNEMRAYGRDLSNFNSFQIVWQCFRGILLQMDMRSLTFSISKTWSFRCLSNQQKKLFEIMDWAGLYLLYLTWISRKFAFISRKIVSGSTNRCHDYDYFVGVWKKAHVRCVLLHFHIRLTHLATPLSNLAKLKNGRR